MEKPYSSTLIRNSNREVIAEVFNYREFAMGAEPVVVLLQNEIQGTKLFITTNGSVVPSSSSHIVYVHDACTVLRIDQKENLVMHWKRPKPYYISGFKEVGNKVQLKLYGGKPYTKEEEVDSIPWEAGFGDVKDGQFPSTHRPVLDWIKLPNRNHSRPIGSSGRAGLRVTFSYPNPSGRWLPPRRMSCFTNRLEASMPYCNKFAN